MQFKLLRPAGSSFPFWKGATRVASAQASPFNAPSHFIIWITVINDVFVQ